jgi:hypothetical protein
MKTISVIKKFEFLRKTILEKWDDTLKTFETATDAKVMPADQVVYGVAQTFFDTAKKEKVQVMNLYWFNDKTKAIEPTPYYAYKKDIKVVEDYQSKNPNAVNTIDNGMNSGNADALGFSSPGPGQKEIIEYIYANAAKNKLNAGGGHHGGGRLGGGGVAVFGYPYGYPYVDGYCGSWEDESGAIIRRPCISNELITY